MSNWPLAAFWTSENLPIAIEFFQTDELIGHRIMYLSTGDQWLLALETIFDHVNDNLVACPMYRELRQSLILSDHSSGKAVMLVGAGGPGHWSACVSQDRLAEEADDTSDAPELDALFYFDVACRTGQHDAKLGDVYRVGENVALKPQGNSLQLTLGDRRQLLLRPLPLKIGDSADSCRVVMSDAKVVVESLTRASDFPATLRWRYALERAPANQRDRRANGQ